MRPTTSPSLLSGAEIFEACDTRHDRQRGAKATGARGGWGMPPCTTRRAGGAGGDATALLLRMAL